MNNSEIHTCKNRLGFKIPSFLHSFKYCILDLCFNFVKYTKSCSSIAVVTCLVSLSGCSSINSFHYAGKMPTTRIAGETILLPNRDVLFALGLQEQRVGLTGWEFGENYSLDLYNYKNNTFSHLKTMNITKPVFSFGVLDVNKFFIFSSSNAKCKRYKFGFADCCPSTEEYLNSYNIQSNQITKLAQLPKVLDSQAVIAINKNSLLIIGVIKKGLTHKSESYALLYNIKTHRFLPTVNKVLYRLTQFPQAILMNNDKIFITGGGPSIQPELFDIKTRSFHLIPTPSYTEMQKAILLTNGNVLLYGDANKQYSLTVKNLDPERSYLELYDPKLNKITFLGGNKKLYVHATPALLNDGRVLFLGGFKNVNDRYPIKSSLIFDIQTRTFKAGPEMPDTLTGFSAVTLYNGNVLLAGGVKNRHISDKFWIFKPDNTIKRGK